MSHPAGAIRNYPFYPILPLSSLPFDLPPWRVAGPRDPATTLLFLGWRPGCRGGGGGGVPQCRGGGGGLEEGDELPGRNTTSASLWLP